MIFNRRRIPRHLLLEDSYPDTPSSASKGGIGRWLFYLCLVGFVGLVAAELARAEQNETVNPRHDPVSPQKAESGELLLVDGSGYQRAIHLQTDVEVDVRGLVANVRYRQQFRNDTRDWREAVYVFPLAENAAIHHMEMRIGDRLIRSQIKEKQQARKIYQQARAEGKKAALTEQQRPNLFTQKVANIGPGETVEIELGYRQRVHYESGQFGFYLPTTLTPRYMPGHQVVDQELVQHQHLNGNPFGWAQPTDQVPDAAEISPPHVPVDPGDLVNPMSIEIHLDAGVPLTNIGSRFHRISHQVSDKQLQTVNNQSSGHRYRIWLKSGQVSMDRDFWLHWSPAPDTEPRAALFKERIDDQDYALLMLLPPQVSSGSRPSARPNATHSLARELIFVIDTSGSMQGQSIVQARKSLLLGLERLQPTDRFNLIEFNSIHRSLFAQPVAATVQEMARARQFVKSLNAGGGTDMAPALEQAFTGTTKPGYLKQIVFITDGAVGNEQALFKLIETGLADARLFTVGIGSAPNSYFMTRAAEFGRGTFEFIGSEQEILHRMNALFRKLESPVLSDLVIDWPDAVEPEQFPARAPDLYAGEPLILSVRAPTLSGELQISGHTANKDWSRSLSLNGPANSDGIATLWARAKIRSLMDAKVRGKPEAEVRDEILKVALPHKLVTAYTSLVAVEQRISRPEGKTAKSNNVPNAVAHGQVLQPQTYPQTATWLPLHLLISAMSLLLLLLQRRFWPASVQKFWPGAK